MEQAEQSTEEAGKAVAEQERAGTAMRQGHIVGSGSNPLQISAINPRRPR